MARGKKVEAKGLEAALVPEAEQPYEVPGNWRWVRAKALFRSMESENPSGETFRYIDIDSIDNANQIVNAPKRLKTSEAPSRAKRKVHTGDTVFSLVRPYLRNIAYIDEDLADCIASTGFFVCTPGDGLDSRFLYQLMRSQYVVNGLNAHMKGDNSPSIRRDDIEAFPLPLPPLAEQRRIVERVESLFAKLDEAEAKLQTVLEASEQRQSAILHAAFTGKLTEKWREEHGLNLYSWAETTLGGCCKVGSGGTPSRKNPEYYTGQIPWVKTGEIDWGCITETEEHITQKAIEDSSAKLYEPGAVLVAMYGMGQTRGKAALLDIRAATNQAVCVFEPCEKLNRHFLFYFFRRNYGDVRSKSVGGNQLNLSATILRRLTISLPSVEEQTAIVAILDECLGKEIEAVAFVNAALATIDTLRQTILAKALHGELGTNDPADPSSLKLLEDILVSRGGST